MENKTAKILIKVRKKFSIISREAPVNKVFALLVRKNCSLPPLVDLIEILPSLGYTVKTYESLSNLR